jgi:hypothetical protein
MVRYLKKLENKKSSLFAMLWFFTALIPVVFLPNHKFSFYLTLPLIGLVYRIGYLLVENKINTYMLLFFCGIWTTLSFLTINYSVNTNWITNGEKIGLRAYNYFKSNDLSGKSIYFIDTEHDKDLPWSPTAVLKNALSGNNFFYVYFPNLANAVRYENGVGYKIPSRIFLGY